MTDREQFEAWWATMEQAPNYEGVQRAVAWNAWQAARAQPAQAVPASCGECGKKTSDGWALYCVACMEKAGLPGGTSSPPLTHSCTSSLVRTADFTAQAVPLHQILTDPENQPNQYGVEFLMHGPKFAFKVGSQQFTLDYEPTEPGEFEFMQAALIYAFSTFTPDVKPAQAVLAKRVPQWQPIETAPKHGRIMLLLLTPSQFPQVAYSNTWWQSGFSVECKPTHWMPLPPPPGIVGKEGA